MSDIPSTKPRPATHVSVLRDGRVATVCFTCESGPPLFSSHVLGELTRILDRLAQDTAVRFVVFRASGSVFNAGSDLHEITYMNEDQSYSLAKHGQHIFDTIENLPQITFAAINGHAVGGGCELALACSFRIMVAGARIGMPEVRLGLIPAWGATKRLPMLVPLGWALRMLYSGELLDADLAHKVGLVDEVVPTEADLNTALQRWFRRFAHAAPRGIIRIKRAILNDDATHQFALSFSCSDAKEGMQAFLEKRKPSWVNGAEDDTAP